MRRLLALVALSACTREEAQAPLCGLHSASAPVVLVGKRDAVLRVGARLLPGDRLEVQGVALLECFGGALRVLEEETVRVGQLTEARIEATTIPRATWSQGRVTPADGLPPSQLPRYSDHQVTPPSALAPSEPTTGDYFRAFFTPHGIEEMGAAPHQEGPAKLPPPSLRTRVAHVHAGPLGEGGPVLEVEDEVVFAETDELATAALVEGHRYALGRTVRLVLPQGAEATLEGVSLEGPLDLRLAR